MYVNKQVGTMQTKDLATILLYSLYLVHLHNLQYSVKNTCKKSFYIAKWIWPWKLLSLVAFQWACMYTEVHCSCLGKEK
jgi:hypothetical protein